MAAAETARPSAKEIYERVIQDARDELARPPSRLGFSALFAGATVGLGGLATAVALAVLGHAPAAMFAANTVGAILLALLVTQTGAVPGRAAHELAVLGEQIQAGPFGPNFWSAVVSGWLLALVAWLVEAAEAAVGQFLVIVALTFFVALGKFDHSVASSTEVFAAMFDGGGGIVAILNYGQVRD